MFCTTLRKRPEWAAVVPLLLGSQVPKWTEKSLESHDIAVPIPRRDGHSSQVRMLLLSKTDMCSTGDGMARIERLYHLDGGREVGIVFLLEEDGREVGKEGKEKESGVVAYMELQARLTSLSFEMAILPLAGVRCLPTTIMAYQRQLLQSRAKPVPVHAMTAILPYCTETPPLAEHAQHVLGDVFTSFRDLALAATTADGQDEIRKWLGEPTPQQAAQVIAFWLQEYVADC